MSEEETRKYFYEALKRLDIPEDFRSKLKECLDDLFSRDQKLFDVLAVKRLETSQLPCVLCFFINLGLAICNLMVALPLIGSVICAVGKYLVSCYEKMQITRNIKEFISNIIFTDCKKAVSKLEIGIGYCLGVLQDLSNATTDAQRDDIVRPVDSNVPVSIGVGGLSVLQTQIQALTKEANIADFDELRSQTELYCIIATLREFVLTLRIVIQPLDRASGITNAFDLLRTDAEELLSFLYKPNQENLKLYLNYRRLDLPLWDIANSYLKRRHLLADMSYLDGKVYHIVSANNPNIHLSLHDWFVCFCMRGSSTTEGRRTHFEFKHFRNNCFTIRCSRFQNHYVSSHAWTRADLGEPDNDRGRWLVVKIDDGKNDMSDCVAFVSATTNYNCIYVDCTGRVHDKPFNPADKRCFWKLKPPTQQIKIK